MTTRIVAVLILLFSVLYMPFWLSMILILGAIAYFSYFIEGVILFLIIDLLYGVIEVKLFNIPFILFIASSSILFLVELLKSKLRI